MKNKMQVKVFPPRGKQSFWRVILYERINNRWEQAIGQGDTQDEAVASAYHRLHPNDPLATLDLRSRRQRL